MLISELIVTLFPIFIRLIAMFFMPMTTIGIAPFLIRMMGCAISLQNFLSIALVIAVLQLFLALRVIRSPITRSLAGCFWISMVLATFPFAALITRPLIRTLSLGLSVIMPIIAALS